VAFKRVAEFFEQKTGFVIVLRCVWQIFVAGFKLPFLRLPSSHTTLKRRKKYTTKLPDVHPISEKIKKMKLDNNPRLAKMASELEEANKKLHIIGGYRSLKECVSHTAAKMFANFDWDEVCE